MTEDKFRELALRFPGAIEAAHMGHPDFRRDGKIFATLGYPNTSWAMVKLTPEQQRECVMRAPAVFAACAGAWGRQGSTHVRLEAAPLPAVRAALAAAWQNLAQTRARRKTAGARRTAS